ncbi:MAG: exodeoxyribonuclease III [Hyphomicrobiales bacterium]|nr:MAG: exodeoxyribonuclease III [Hyphomicrobiales bacterium]
MKLRIATWNINSVRLRAPQVVKFLQEEAPDVLCLQEIKCENDAFPTATFRKAGYEHMAVNGQKGYHGVAIVSRRPITNVDRRGFCGKSDSRHISAVLGAVPGQPVLHNFYVPAGGDEPDPERNDKFAHKLDFLDEMTEWFAASAGKGSQILVGDLNIAPFESDVWSHKQLLKVVSHTPVEVERLARVRGSLDWVDVMRAHTPEPEKLFTWWSYRAKDWRASNRGRRLDHIWVTPDLAGSAEDMRVIEAARSWERPSDHAPVIADFRF